MLPEILTPEQTGLIREERESLARLQMALGRLDADPEDEEALRQSIHQLDELFLLVVVGEFNAGKSAFINALLGERLLEEGVTPTTTRIQLLSYSEDSSRELLSPALERIGAPAPILKQTHIVDTPGTNAIHREHEAITTDYVPRSDLVLFVTSSDRPFTESERGFLETIREWGKKIVVVINKIDILEKADEIEDVTRFVTENVSRLLGFQPKVFPLSGRRALRAQEAGEPVPEEFRLLEKWIQKQLAPDERLRLKLLNPLGVGGRTTRKYIERLKDQLDVLAADLKTVDEIETQLALFEEDAHREFDLRLSDIEKVLAEFENRGVAFFEERLRLGRVFDLINRKKTERDYEKEVVSDAPRQVESRVESLIDWLVSSELREWKHVMGQLNERRTENTQRVSGRIGEAFEYDRSRLLDSVGRDAEEALKGYDVEAESARLGESVQLAVAQTALLEVGAVGLGTIVSLVATTTMADVTGILAAGVLATIGLFVIPARKKKATRELRKRLAEVKTQLVQSLRAQFQRERKRSQAKIEESIAPYTLFVRARRKKIEERQTILSELESEQLTLRERVGSL